MNKLAHVLAISAMVGAAPVAAQVREPGPTEAPSAAAIAACTSQVASRWADMVPSEQAKRTQQELIRTCAINMDVASYAIAQNQMIKADQQQAAAAKAAHEAAVLKFQEDKKAWEAAVQQQKDDYAASYSQWEADAAACKAGNLSKCAPKN